MVHANWMNNRNYTGTNHGMASDRWPHLLHLEGLHSVELRAKALQAKAWTRGLSHDSCRSTWDTGSSTRAKGYQPVVACLNSLA